MEVKTGFLVCLSLQLLLVERLWRQRACGDNVNESPEGDFVDGGVDTEADFEDMNNEDTGDAPEDHVDSLDGHHDLDQSEDVEEACDPILNPSGCDRLRWCGDGEVQVVLGEQCEAGQPVGSCASLGFEGGALGCEACRLDLSACYEPVTPSLTSGAYSTCALDEGGRLTCWGVLAESHGDLGLAQSDGHTGCLRWLPDRRFFQVRHVDVALCGITNPDRGLLCHGFVEGGWEQLSAPLREVAIARERYVEQTAATGGAARGCVLTMDGAVACWGEGFNPEARLPEGMSFVRVELVGPGAVCALSADGEVACAGVEGFDVGSLPERAPGFRAIAASQHRLCAIRVEDGGLTCWGTPPRDATYEVVAGAGRFAQAQGLRGVAIKDHVTCVLSAASVVECEGPLHIPGREEIFARLERAPQEPVDAFSVGNFHGCSSRADDGVTTCWGNNFHWLTPAPDVRFERMVGDRDGVCGLIKGEDRYTCWGTLSPSMVHVNPNQPTPRPSPPELLVDPPDVPLTSIEVDFWLCGVEPERGIHCWGRRSLETPYHFYPGDFGDLSLNAPRLCAVRRGAPSRVECWSIGDDAPPWQWAEEGFEAVEVATFTNRDGGLETHILSASGELRCEGNGCPGEGLWRVLQATPVQRLAPTMNDLLEGQPCVIDRRGRLLCWDTRGAIVRVFGGEGGPRPEQEWEALGEGVYRSRDAFLELGDEAFCGLRVDGELICWSSALEQPPADDFVPLRFSTRFDQLFMGGVCGLSDGQVVCRGQMWRPEVADWASIKDMTCQ